MKTIQLIVVLVAAAMQVACMNFEQTRMVITQTAQGPVWTPQTVKYSSMLQDQGTLAVDVEGFVPEVVGDPLNGAEGPDPAVASTQFFGQGEQLAAGGAPRAGLLIYNGVQSRGGRVAGRTINSFAGILTAGWAYNQNVQAGVEKTKVAADLALGQGQQALGGKVVDGAVTTLGSNLGNNVEANTGAIGALGRFWNGFGF
jgi:hypothetical protein